MDDPKTHHTDPSHASVARTLASMELLSQGFNTWESYINAAEILRTMFVYSADPQPAMSRGAKNAIFQIAGTNMTLVIGTLTFDATHAKKTEDRAQCLRIIGSFIRKVWIVSSNTVVFYSSSRFLETSSTLRSCSSSGRSCS